MLTIGQHVVYWVGCKTHTRFYEATGIGWTKDNKIIAGVVYDQYNGANINMHVAGTGKSWLTREYLRTCFDYPFNQLKVKRITGTVPESNKQAIKFDENLGFVLEATLIDAHPDGNLRLYRMFKHECRFLTDKYGKIN